MAWSNFKAYSTNPFSVGSPFATSSPGVIIESEHRAIALASNPLLSVYSSWTVILFCVKVPVLSVHIICVQPNVSTAFNFLINAFRLLIAVTPIDRIIVTTAGSPSGIAATANAIAVKVVSIITFAFISPALDSVTINTMTQIARTIFVKTFESSAIFLWRGVVSFIVSWRLSAIFPISVFIPVSTTTAFPRP